MPIPFRVTLLSLLGLLTAPFLVHGGVSTATAAESLVTVYRAKKFYTMDPGWPQAAVVAVQDGKILSVGRDLEDLQPWLKGREFKLDETLKDKIVLPGFIEAHGHPLLGGLLLNFPLISYLPTAQPYGPDFPGVKTPDEALALVKKYVSEAKDPQETVIHLGLGCGGYGWPSSRQNNPRPSLSHATDCRLGCIRALPLRQHGRDEKGWHQG